MTNKQIIVLILAFTLVAVFCATGVFADSFVPVAGWNDYGLPNQVDFSSTDLVGYIYGYFTYSGDIHGQTIHFSFDYDSAPSSGAFIFPNVTENKYINYTNLVNCFVYGNGLKSNGNVTHFEFDATWTSSFDQQTVTISGQTFNGIIARLDGNPISFTVTLSGGPVVSTVSEVIPLDFGPGYAYVVDGACEILERHYSITGSWNFTRENGTIPTRVNGSVNRVLDSVNVRDSYSPDYGYTFDRMIQWTPTNENSQGVASNYSFSSNDSIVLYDGECYVITYPEYLGILNVVGDDVSHMQNAVDFTGSLYIQYSGTRPSFKKVALETVENWSGRIYTMYNVFRPNVYSETGTVVDDGSGNTSVTFPDAPLNGGNTGQPPLNEDTNIVSLLSRFVNNITSLFNNAGQAINNVVQACNSFFSAVMSFFGWLPAEWSAVLWSFFLILTVLGVVKLFL